MRALARLAPLAPLGLLALLCGCSTPDLDRVRFDVSASDAVAKMVTWTKLPDSDGSSKLKGVDTNGIVLQEGVAVVVTLEPQSNDKGDLDGDISADTVGDSTVATIYPAEENDGTTSKTRFVLIANAVGTSEIDVEISGHDGTGHIPLTVAAQVAQ